ncbi:TIGR04211 family SH3 domain-containing protein [Methylocucumis oryzae]|uniref:TIGR04211 family SH3 domain-containing protein n=1 Tax=Methylocucumis oryzae TaxID=1632867 RepID=UPI001EF9E867|nr:TIGR04211 family SH3 domain-containing protein [Methylocucumis oryzae]
MKNIKLALVLLLSASAAHAETVYVTDNLNLSLRSEPNNDAKVVKLVATGTPLIVVGEKNKAGFTRVKLSNGIEGYIQTRQIQKEPPAREQMESLNKTIKSLQAENLGLKAELKSGERFDYTRNNVREIIGNRA